MFDNKIVRLACVAFCVWPALTEFASAEVHSGRPLWRLFDARHTGAADVTRTATFDERGLVYAANESGLLSFDGTSWSITSTGPNSLPIHAILNLGDGIWLAGGPSVLGTFAPTAQGTHTWRPLSEINVTDGNSENTKKFEDAVLSMFQHDDNTYVITDRNVLLLKGDAPSPVSSVIFDVIFNGAPTGFSFTIGPDLFIDNDANLIRINNNKTNDIPAPAGWSTLNPIDAFVDADGNTIIATQRSGLFKATSDNGVLSLAPLWEILPPALETEEVTTAVRHEDGSFVFGTTKGSVLHLDPNGETVRSLEKRNGFYAGSVRTMAVRDDGNLIAFFDGGAVWLDLTDTRRVWDSKNGLVGSVTALALGSESVFAGTDSGLYRTGSGHRMRQIIDVGPNPILTLNVFKRSNIQAHTSLLIGREDGLFDYFDNRLQPILGDAPRTVFISRTQPARIAVGLRNAITLFEFEQGGWTDLGTLGPPTSHAVVDITETPEGDLLAVLTDGTIMRFLADQWLSEKQLEDVTPVDVQTFSRKVVRNSRPVFAADGDNIHLFLPQSGLKWDLRAEQFRADTELATELTRIHEVKPPLWHSAARSADRLWLQSHGKSFVMETDPVRLTQLPLVANGTYRFNSISIDAKSRRVLFATPDGISAIPADWSNASRHKRALPPLSLRKMSIDGQELYGGEGPLPTITISTVTSSLTLNIALLNWPTLCGDGHHDLDILQSGATIRTIPVGPDCKITLSGAGDLNALEGAIDLRLVHNTEPVSTNFSIKVEAVTPWFVGGTIPVTLAILFAALSVAGGQKTRRVWPEPIRRYMALLSGLCLCFAGALSLDSILLTGGFLAVAGWLASLLTVAFLLPIFAEVIMRLGDRYSPSAR